MNPNTHQKGSLPDHLGLEWREWAPGQVTGALALRPEHLAPNGYLHAAVVVALADTACGYDCMLALPEAATGFTTVELKTNFLGTARAGEITARARLSHGGRRTQVWDAEVMAEGRETPIALFRCTQMILYPRG